MPHSEWVPGIQVRYSGCWSQMPARRAHLAPAAAGQVVEEVEAAGVDVHAGRPQAAGPVGRDRIDEVGRGARRPRRHEVPFQCSMVGCRSGGPGRGRSATPRRCRGPVTVRLPKRLGRVPGRLRDLARGPRLAVPVPGHVSVQGPDVVRADRAHLVGSGGQPHLRPPAAVVMGGVVGGAEAEDPDVVGAEHRGADAQPAPAGLPLQHPGRDLLERPACRPRSAARGSALRELNSQKSVAESPPKATADRT